MDNLVLSLEIVAPLFLLMAVGYVVRCFGLVDENAVRKINTVVFKVFLPTLVFFNIYKTNLQESFQPQLLLYGVLAVLAEFFIALGIVIFTEKDKAKRGVMLQGMFRSNFVLFGIPVTTALFGDTAAGIAAILIAVIIPLFNVLAVISLEIFQGGRPNVKKILFGIVTNPLILASAAGILFLLLGWKLPTILHKTVFDLSSVATPLAFVLLGASFRFSEVQGYLKPLSITLGVKLLVFPALFVAIAVAFGFRGAPLAVLLTVFGSPIAVSSFTMAQQMGGDEKLASQLVIFSSILSIVTVFFFILLLKETAFF